MASDWQYSKSGQTHGPVSASELRALAQSGELSFEDMVRKEGMDDWKAAGTIKGLFDPSESTATSARSPSGNKPMPEPTFTHTARKTVEKVAKTSEEVSETLWFLDLKFETFATPKLIGFGFLAWMVIALLVLVATAVYGLLNYTALHAVLGVLTAAAGLVLCTILVRVLFESLLIAFRVAENLSHLKTIAEALSVGKE